MDKPNLAELRQYVREHDFPTDVLVETSTNCNLDCVMCPQSGLTRPRGEMSFALWRRIMDEIAEVSPSTRIWPALMGEPLLRADRTLAMIRYAKQQGIEAIHLNTNLMALREADIDGLLDSGVDEVLVGLDAARPATYAAIRRGGDLDRVRRTIELILDRKAERGLDKPAVTLQFVVMKENAVEEQAFIDSWRDCGRDLKLKLKPRTGWADGVAPSPHILNVSQQRRDLPCTWLLRQMSIFWNGDVPQCDGDWNGRTNFGNVNEMTLGDIWRTQLKTVRDRHMRLDFDFAPCRKCEDWQAGKARWIEVKAMANQAG